MVEKFISEGVNLVLTPQSDGSLKIKLQRQAKPGEYFLDIPELPVIEIKVKNLDQLTGGNLRWELSEALKAKFREEPKSFDEPLWRIVQQYCISEYLDQSLPIWTASAYGKFGWGYYKELIMEKCPKLVSEAKLFIQQHHQDLDHDMVETVIFRWCPQFIDDGEVSVKERMCALYQRFEIFGPNDYGWVDFCIQYARSSCFKDYMFIAGESQRRKLMDEAEKVAAQQQDTQSMISRWVRCGVLPEDYLSRISPTLAYQNAVHD